MNQIIKDLNWRYATKKFDPTKKVSSEDLATIKESLRLTATSFGLQSMKFLIIENPEVREQLKPASWGQTQVTDASHLIVLCSYIDVNNDHVDEYMQDVASARSLPLEATTGFGDYIKGAIANFSAEEKAIWSSKQAYIALGQALHTCANLRIDSTPMEGFDPAAYDEILGLSAKNLKATLLLPIGYRHEEDQNQHYAKVRKSNEAIFETI
ncbi:MAG: NAD(P)H-dependent oxidoreductase [Crocinitomicaceae bacterium]|nr:NAD(P)H-dependent oxidoreductase [Crocinitomicaceae bacterium]